MTDKFDKQIRLHSAGATVQHAGPFKDLEIPTSAVDPEKDFITKWVTPFYMTDFSNSSSLVEHYGPLRNEIDTLLINRLLTFFNWRPRIVGGYFAAIENMTDLCNHIGRLLLRSDVCFAAEGYALALARFNSEESIGFLRQYLDYYLTRPDLWFDQSTVMAALAYVDVRNNTKHCDEFIAQWNEFTKDKPHWDLETSVESFRVAMDTVLTVDANTK